MSHLRDGGGTSTDPLPVGRAIVRALQRDQGFDNRNECAPGGFPGPVVSGPDAAHRAKRPRPFYFHLCRSCLVLADRQRRSFNSAPFSE